MLNGERLASTASGPFLSNKSDSGTQNASPGVQIHSENVQYRGLLEAIPSAVYTTDLQGRITFYNRAAALLLGREPELKKELWGGLWRVFHPDGTPMEIDACPMAVTIREGRAVCGVEIVIERPDGSRRLVLAHSESIHDESGMVVGAINLLDDITGQRETESARWLLSEIVSSCVDAIISMTLEGTITSWNAAAERMFGYTSQEAVGRHITMLIPPERVAEEDVIQASLRRGERVEQFETERVAKDGRRLQVSLTTSPVRNGAGQIIGASKIVRDMTQRRLIEEAPRESEVRFRAIFGQAAVGIALLDRDGRFLDVNDRLSEIVGVAPEALRGRACAELTHPTDRAGNKILLGELIRGERKSFSIEKRLRRLDGSWTWVAMSVRPLVDERDRPLRMVAIIEDIQERKELREELERKVLERTSDLEHAQAQLRERERLASLGTLSAGLGHDLANLIMPLRMRLDRLARLPEADSAAAANEIGEIRRGLDYLQHLSAGLRQMAIDPTVASAAHEHTSLDQWWEQAEGILRAVMPRGARIEAKIEPGLDPVSMRSPALTQAVFNLVHNSAEAMGNGSNGLVSVAAEADPTAPADAPRVLLTVSDNGPGMQPETVAHCFEPYFSTKSRSISTGMGLTLVRSMMLTAGGKIRCESTPGKGARFTLVIPSARAGRGGSACDAPVVATVSLGSPRRAALASAVLDALGVRVQRDTTARDGELWVCDAAEPTEIQAFLAGPGQRCLILWRELPQAGNTNERVMYCGAAPDTRTMQSCFEMALVKIRPAAVRQTGDRA